MNDKNYETKLSPYLTWIGEDSHLWELRVKAAFPKNDQVEAMEEGLVDRQTSGKSLSIFIAALSDNSLRSIQVRDATKGAWDKSKHRYADMSVVNKLGVLNNLLNAEFKNDTDEASRCSY